MSNVAIRQQYDNVIAADYDLDPQEVIRQTSDVALELLRRERMFSATLPSMKILDVGMGTGLFMQRIHDLSDRELQFFGLDISERMVDVARVRLPGLSYAIDDAVNLDKHFADDQFDLICTHFITGFVPIDYIAPLIWQKLRPGGYWSFIGATRTAFPELQKKAQARWLQTLFGGRSLASETLLSPVDEQEVAACFECHGFETRESRQVRPMLHFKDFSEFMEFGYQGGWLTPFIEELGLQSAQPWLTKILNRFVFPVSDAHHVAVGIAQRPM